jgi:uncharacterized protein
MIKCLFLFFLPLTGISQPIISEDFALKTTTGVIQGTLTLPSATGKNIPVVLLIAGSGPTDRNCNGPGFRTDTYKKLAEALAIKGIALLRYDKRGVAGSMPAAGREETLTFDTYIEDAVAWVDTLRKTNRFEKIIVAGHSEGSLVGIVAARRAQADRYISIAGAGQNVHEVLKTQLATLPDSMRMEAYRSLDSLRAGHKVKKPHPFLYSLFRPSVQPYIISWMQYDPSEEIKKLDLPVAIVQGGRDIQVTMSEAEKLRKACPTAEWIVFETMNHVLKDALADRNGNMAIYNQPDLALTEGLAAAVATFVNGH